MDNFRERYGQGGKSVMFLILSDDPGWVRENLVDRAEDAFYAGAACDVNTIEVPCEGHDLAVLSLCDHVIASHGTFGFWAGLLAGGEMTVAEGFAEVDPVEMRKLKVASQGVPM